MAPRLIIVSNRVSVPVNGKPAPAGGLAVAVKAALRNRSGLWFGWSGNASETPNMEPTFIERNRVTYAVIDLALIDYQEYYNGFANRVLWPILHYRVDLAEYSHTDLGGYQRVNRIFADKLAEMLTPDDLIWVHDYHLMPLAQELRARGCDNPIGFFLHIPCPPPDILVTMPRHEEVLGSLSHYDLVGFQTENDRENFGRYLTQLGGVLARDFSTCTIQNRTLRMGVFRNSSRSAFVRDFQSSLRGAALIVGVDRLDYSKGLRNRLEGYERFLVSHPELRQKVSYLQITPTSRGEIKEYAEIDRMVSETVGRINGRFGEASWTPIRYVNRSYSRIALASIYRTARVALVTPLRDGMNLVAKEYVAAQDPEDPGVLILSQFAGAAAELDGALMVNPHEVEAIPFAINRGLAMPLEERIERHKRMYERIGKYDVDQWAQSFLQSLADARRKPGLLDGLRSLFLDRAVAAR